MLNYEFKNPTKILFGKGQIASIAKEIPLNAKVLVLYGGGSIQKNGIYQQVKQALHGHSIVEFGGILANPEYEVLVQALSVIKSQGIGFLLAVGGGSVIDGTKFLAAAATYKGDDTWDILAKNLRIEDALPFGTVLTLPGTGSEMNSGAVISRHEIFEKRAMGGPALFPKFSILDPCVVSSIPRRQIENGLGDSFAHVMEQYMTYPIGADLQDRISESILASIMETSSKILKSPTDYTLAANYMWCCTMALNGLIQKGVPTDWSVHMIAHELTALYSIDHARTLAIIMPASYKLRFEQKKMKLAQFAQRVLNVSSGTIEQQAQQALEAISAFYHTLDMPTQLSAYVNDYEGCAEKIAQIFEQRGWQGLGEHKDIGAKEAKEIVRMSY